MSVVFYRQGDPYVSSSKGKDNKVRKSDTHPSTWLEVDLSVLHSNVLSIQSVLGDTGIIAVVKSDGYGLGLVPVVVELEKLGVAGVGVATSDDALTLRRAGISGKIIVIYPLLETEITDLIVNAVDITISTVDQLMAVRSIADKLHVTAHVHIAIETGMHHYGAGLDLISSISRIILEASNIKLVGVSTHFADVSGSKQLTKKQYDVFKDALRELAARGLEPTYIHCANSAALDQFRPSWDKSTFQEIMPSSSIVVRVGAILYGLYDAVSDELRTYSPARRLVSRLVEVKEVQKGDFIGYFGDFRAVSNITIGILPVGWGSNGYFPSGGVVLVSGQQTPIIGKIGANTCTIDLTNIQNYYIGQEVELFSEEAKEVNLKVAAHQQSMFTSRFLAAIGSVSVRGYVNFTNE